MTPEGNTLAGSAAMRSRAGRGHRTLRLATGLAVALLLNALTLAPALHPHGPGHDADACPICLLQAHGVWAPADAAPVMATQRSPLPAPQIAAAPVLAAHLPAAAARGPPPNA